MGSSAKGEKPSDPGQPIDGEKTAAEVRVGTPSAASPTDAYPNDHPVSDAIGKALQAHYRALTEAPLPDRFRVLLAQLEAKDSQDDQ